MTIRELVSGSMFVFVAASMSWGSLSRNVWSPQRLEWPNPLRKPPEVFVQANCPLLITNPRYYSFISIGSGIGGDLRFEVTNTSNKPVHSYHCRYYSSVPLGNGSYGTEPENGLRPRRSREDSISAHDYAPLTLTIDFVQFADGTTWFSDSPSSVVKPRGLYVGEKTARNYLLAMLREDGIKEVLDTLPHLHAQVLVPYDTMSTSEFGLFGFYCGVTNVGIRVANAYKSGGRAAVETILRS